MTLTLGFRIGEACCIIADSATSVMTKYLQAAIEGVASSGEAKLDRVGSMKLIEFDDFSVAFAGNVRLAYRLVGAIHKNRDLHSPLDRLRRALDGAHSEISESIGGLSLLFSYRESGAAYLASYSSSDRTKGVQAVSHGELVMQGSGSSETKAAMTNLLEPWISENPTLEYGFDAVASVLPALLDAVSTCSIAKVHSELIGPPFLCVCTTPQQQFRRGASVHNLMTFGDPPTVKQIGIDQKSKSLSTCYYESRRIYTEAFDEDNKGFDTKHHSDEIVRTFTDASNLRCLSFACPQTRRSMVIYSARGNFLPYVDVSAGVLSYEVSDWMNAFDIDQNGPDEGLLRVEVLKNA